MDGMPTADSPLGTPYHRLAHLRPEWERPGRAVLTLLIAAVAYSILASLLIVASVLALSATGADARMLGAADGPLAVHPLALAMLLAFGAIGWPAAWLGVRLGGWRPAAWLWSIEARPRTALLRDPWLWLLPGGAALASAVIETTARGSWGLHGRSPGEAILAVIVVLLLGPLSAIGTEMLLRGLVLQVVGTWVRPAAAGVAVATIAALIGHTSSVTAAGNALLLGVLAGVLTWLSGGIEAAIAIHASSVIPVTLVAILGGPSPADSHGAVAALLVGAPVVSVLVRRRAASRGRAVPLARASDAPTPPPIAV